MAPLTLAAVPAAPYPKVLVELLGLQLWSGPPPSSSLRAADLAAISVIYQMLPDGVAPTDTPLAPAAPPPRPLPTTMPSPAQLPARLQSPRPAGSQPPARSRAPSAVTAAVGVQTEVATSVEIAISASTTRGKTNAPDEWGAAWYGFLDHVTLGS